MARDLPQDTQGGKPVYDTQRNSTWSTLPGNRLRPKDLSPDELKNTNPSNNGGCVMPPLGLRGCAARHSPTAASTWGWLLLGLAAAAATRILGGDVAAAAERL